MEALWSVQEPLWRRALRYLRAPALPRFELAANVVPQALAGKRTEYQGKWCNATLPPRGHRAGLRTSSSAVPSSCSAPAATGRPAAAHTHSVISAQWEGSPKSRRRHGKIVLPRSAQALVRASRRSATGRSSPPILKPRLPVPETSFLAVREIWMQGAREPMGPGKAEKASTVATAAIQRRRSFPNMAWFRWAKGDSRCTQ